MMDDLIIINQPSRHIIRCWSQDELNILKQWPVLETFDWSQEEGELYHPSGDRLYITEIGYTLWNEFGEFPDITFTNLGQACLYLANT